MKCPRYLMRDISQILSQLASAHNFIARIFGVYESIGKASERETRRKSSLQVIRACRLTNDHVIGNLNHVSASTM